MLNLKRFSCRSCESFPVSLMSSECSGRPRFPSSTYFVLTFSNAEYDSDDLSRRHLSLPVGCYELPELMERIQNGFQMGVNAVRD
ncbi:uncharacterized [Tachysurus ichikawai]